MKIALVLANTPAYSETFFNSKIKGLQQNGFEVTLYTRIRQQNFELCPVVQAPDFAGNVFHKIEIATKTFFTLIPHWKAVYRFLQLERQSNRKYLTSIKHLFINSHLLTAKADWVHFGFATLAVGSENVAKAIGAKMAVSFRGFDINVYPLKHAACYYLLWQNIDKVHSISHYLLEKAEKLGLSKEVSSQIITPAVVIESLPEPAQELSRNKIVTIARFNWIKGLDIALKAIAILKSKGVVVTYHIIGSGSSEEEERIRFLVHLLALEKQVVFHGKCTHAQTLSILKDAHIYLQPSLNEGFCNAVLEAQVLGIPCVVTNGGALPENVKNGETGWVVPVHDPNQMAVMLEKVVKMEQETLHKMRTKWIHQIQDQFNIKKQQQQFIEFYTQA
ncbi:glycosyltransferase family 4 protein [Ascidiimonas sp. W6]|uniref:glycosyltransferase family 4 protein n=1 Tax=Ascidiimonas meishanensis TaxID=3128903 RepID=UPI0030EEF40A